jgi:Domain of unknown function (DUF4136)
MTMKKLFAVAALGVALSTAMPAIARPVQVTRFAVAEAIVLGPVAPMKAAVSLEQSTYDAAVAQELARIGFSGEGVARYDYTAEVTKDVRRDPVRRSPVTIGIGRDTTLTTLFVQLRDRATGKTVWEGRAEAESTAPGGERVERLAAALLRDFPGPSGRTISVK